MKCPPIPLDASRFLWDRHENIWGFNSGGLCVAVNDPCGLQYLMAAYASEVWGDLLTQLGDMKSQRKHLPVHHNYLHWLVLPNMAEEKKREVFDRHGIDWWQRSGAHNIVDAWWAFGRDRL